MPANLLPTISDAFNCLNIRSCVHSDQTRVGALRMSAMQNIRALAAICKKCGRPVTVPGRGVVRTARA